MKVTLTVEFSLGQMFCRKGMSDLHSSEGAAAMLFEVAVGLVEVLNHELSISGWMAQLSEDWESKTWIMFRAPDGGIHRRSGLPPSIGSIVSQVVSEFGSSDVQL